MKARASNYPAGPVSAFGGVEFVKYEWRDVPDGFEDEAEQHPYLEVLEVQSESVKVPTIETVEVKPKAKLKPKPTNGRRRRKAAPKGKK